MTVKELQKKQQKLGYTLEQIAYISGVSLEIVQEVFEGNRTPDQAIRKALDMVFELEDDDPDAEQEVLCGKMKHAETIRRALRGEAEPADIIGEAACEKNDKSDIIREAQAAYRAVQQREKQRERCQGEYTIEDYWAIRDECRVELIDGVFYDMATPKWIHQEISFLIGMELRLFIKKKGGTCIVSGGPVSTRLDCDDKTMLEPDVTVICDRNKLQNGYIYGAPDLVIEILSRSTAKRDKTIKRRKYQKAGVREYWIVDPKKKVVIVYHFEKGDIPTLYRFEDQIPVGIFAGECKVDFGKIYKEVEFLYER